MANLDDKVHREEMRCHNRIRELLLEYKPKINRLRVKLYKAFVAFEKNEISRNAYLKVRTKFHQIRENIDGAGLNTFLLDPMQPFVVRYTCHHNIDGNIASRMYTHMNHWGAAECFTVYKKCQYNECECKHYQGYSDYHMLQKDQDACVPTCNGEFLQIEMQLERGEKYPYYKTHKCHGTNEGEILVTMYYSKQEMTNPNDCPFS